VIGSDTPPVREVISSGENGLLVPFFAVDELSERVIEALQEPAKFSSMRQAARRFVIDHYDAEQVCIPRMRRLLDLKSPSMSSPRNFWPGRSLSDLPQGTKRASRKSSAAAGLGM
jgi:hypothetical protein